MNNLAVLNEPFFGNVAELHQNQYSQLITHYDSKYKISWAYMNASPRPCFTPTLIKEFHDYAHKIKMDMIDSEGKKYDYLVIASNVEGIFNLGGDLTLFRSAIKNGDRQGLLRYATQCIDMLYQNIIHLDSDLTTISLVQGDALGGGFETALSSNLLIAERGTKMGFPEALFNLFPGMGAYPLLSRKVGPSLAEKIMLSGQLYSAEELFDMGIVDILAEKGDGDYAVYKYIKSARRSQNSYNAMRKVKDRYNLIGYQELVDVINIWVDTALNLTDKDLRMMERLVSHQNFKVVK